jgi:acyl carrier protein
MSILEEAKEVVAEQLSVEADTIKPDSKFIDDLGADSLDIVELVMALEEKFDIEIPDSDAESIITLQNAVDYIEKNK